MIQQESAEYGDMVVRCMDGQLILDRPPRGGWEK